jgi:hypothetical protein
MIKRTTIEEQFELTNFQLEFERRIFEMLELVIDKEEETLP